MIFSDYIFNTFTYSSSYNRIVHGIEMNPLNVAYQKVYYLTESIRHSCIKKSFTIILITVNYLLKSLRKCSITYAYHPFDSGLSKNVKLCLNKFWNDNYKINWDDIYFENLKTNDVYRNFCDNEYWSCC